MTQAQVRAIWGDPVESEHDELWKGRVEIWYYPDGRSVQFSTKHRVLAIDR